MTRAEIMMLHDEGNEIAACSRAHPDLTILARSEMQGEVRGHQPGRLLDAMIDFNQKCLSGYSDDFCNIFVTMLLQRGTL
jgi:hypothetical protein